MTNLSAGLVCSILLTLRIAPALAFAPPFTLVRVPVLARVLLGLGFSASIGFPHAARVGFVGTDLSAIGPAACAELALGLMFVLALQLAFGALYLAGRTIDVQAGFGLALLIDPTGRNQTPLVGTLFVYAAGAIFFTLDGHLTLLRMILASLDAVPLGGWVPPGSVERVGMLAGITSSMALGFAGSVIAALFIVDLAIALLSRTVPQMNVLVLGFQVKTLILLAVLPLVFGLHGVLLVRLLAAAYQAIPGVI